MFGVGSNGARESFYRLVSLKLCWCNAIRPDTVNLTEDDNKTTTESCDFPILLYMSTALAGCAFLF